MPQVTILGVYPVDITDELFDSTLTQHYGLVALDTDAERREEAAQRTRDLLHGVVVVELVVRSRDRTMYMGDFGQASLGDKLQINDQVAYGEAFLSPAGDRLIASNLDEVDARDVRVAFFLHFFRHDRPLLTSYGPVMPPPLTAMPPRLKRIMKYEAP